MNDLNSEKLFAIVPDFLRYGRLLKTGNGIEILKNGASKSALLKAIWKTAQIIALSPLKAAKQDFWLAAAALLSYDLALLGKNFKGSIVLHPYLTDLAFSLMQKKFIVSFFSKNKKWGRKGIWTFQAPLALSLLMKWNQKPNFLIYHHSKNDLNSPEAIQAAQTSSFFENTLFINDIIFNFPRTKKEGPLILRPATPEAASQSVPSAL